MAKWRPDLREASESVIVCVGEGSTRTQEGEMARSTQNVHVTAGYVPRVTVKDFTSFAVVEIAASDDHAVSYFIDLRNSVARDAAIALCDNLIAASMALALVTADAEYRSR